MDQRGDLTAIASAGGERGPPILNARTRNKLDSIRYRQSGAEAPEIAPGPSGAGRTKVVVAPEDAIICRDRALHPEPAAPELPPYVKPKHPTGAAPRCAARNSSAVPDSEPSETALLDPEGFILCVNEAWREAGRATDPDNLDGGVGLRCVDVMGGLLSEGGAQAMRVGLQELAAGRCVEFTQVYVVSTPTGLRWRRQHIAPLPSPWTGFLISHKDITELEDARATLRTTPDQLLRVQEQERERIAIELHDSTGQHLVALGLGIRRVRQLTSNNQEVSDVLEDMTASVRAAMREIRVLSYLSQSAGLLRASLEATIRNCVLGFMARSELETTFEAVGPIDQASGPTRHAVLRIVQEALSNAYRHSEASRVDVQVALSGELLSLRVCDNGKGISNPCDGGASGVGLMSMRARVASLKGRLTIASSLMGVSIEALLPLRLAAN